MHLEDNYPDPLTGEDLINASMEARGRQFNLSFFAFTAVLQTMIDSHFDMFKRINDNDAFAKKVREVIFEQVYGEILERVRDE